MIETVINPSYKSLEPFIQRLSREFHKSGEVIFEARNTIKIFEYEGLSINVKSFKVPNLINQLIYKSFRSSKAKRSFEYANLLLQKGFLTPEPIGYIETSKYTLFKNSYYVSRQETFDGMMKELRHGSTESKEILSRQFGIYTAQLHEQKIIHHDYSPSNILYKKQDDKYKFYLVDLNRMTFNKTIDLESGCFSFRRLWGNDDMIRMIVEEYAKIRKFDLKTCLEKTFEYRELFWNKYLKKYPNMIPYWG